jgi:uncharacterized protein (TIGR03083 family)
MGAMQRWIDQLAAECSRFTEVLAEGDLDAVVPSCPGWSLADLADHLGGVYQWAAHAITHGTPDGVAEPAPRDRAGLTQWYSGHAAALLGLLGSHGADDPAWGFGPKPRTVAFWARRQLHETAIHHWDACASQGQTVALDEHLALDGVDEVLTVFFPRQVRLGRMAPLTHSLALDSVPGGAGADGSAPSRFVLAGDGTAGPGADVAPDARVAGPAEALLLLLWNRTTLDDARLTVTGDRLAAAHVLGAGIVP